jgi:uncharacterized membrane protein (DUF4010 family)
LALPPWFAVGFTVIAVLLLTGREKLHALARRVDVDEVITAGEFLILTGIVLPLLPNEPVTTLTTITPRHAWLALVVVCSLSYASYLAQRYWAAAARGLWMAALGGLYSSTATTVVLARQARSDGAMRGSAQAGITLATAIMYLRILAIVAFFNWTLARQLAPALIGLSLAGLVICALQYRFAERPAEAKAQATAQATAQETGQETAQETRLRPTGGNPLELGPAALFAALFVAVSLVSNWAKTEFGTSGIYTLAAIVGVTDIDPFVLNLAQGGTTGMSNSGRTRHDFQCRGAGPSRRRGRDHRDDNGQRITPSGRSHAGARLLGCDLGRGPRLTESNKHRIANTDVSECPDRSEKPAPHLERRERPARPCTQPASTMVAAAAAAAEDRISSRPPCAAKASLRPRRSRSQPDRSDFQSARRRYPRPPGP